MKSINSYLKFILVTTLIAVWGVSGIAYATGNGHDHDDYEEDTPEVVIPSCPFNAQDGRTIVTFNSDETHWLLSNKTDAEAQLPVSASLTAGKYTISLFSYDGYIGRDEVIQSDESWFVILKNGSTEVARSSAVSDLEDYVTTATRNETVDVGLTLSSDVDSVVAYHAAYPSNKKFPNSVAPICAAFDKITEPPAPSPTKGSITVCKAIVDAEGNLVDGSALGGSTFSIAGIDFAGNKTAPKAVGVLPTSQFSVPLSFTADIFGHDGVNDAQCVTYSDLKIGSYFYDEESITGEGWLAPKYNDQFKTSVHSINDLFVYSNEIFTPDLSDDSARNTNSDGHIILNKTRPNRTLVVLNTMAPTPVNEKPVITLIGDNPLEVIIGTTFTDPGATAEDAEDGDISGQIVVGGDIVDTSELGSFTVTYNVTDSQGAAADQVTRTVNIVALGDTECSDAVDNDGDELIDAEDPTCHTDGNAGNPDSYDQNINDENAKPVITLVGEDPVSVTQGSSYADQGATASDEEDGDITEDIVVGGDTIDTNTIGTYTITYNVTDSQGAAADEVTRTVEVVSGGTNGGGENPACSDSLDNDEDGLTDSEDPACHTDGDAENPESYDGDLDSENSKPIITLTGAATSTVTVGGTFTDPGATASDEEDGDITEDIVVGGDTIDTNTIGTYTITYNVTDSQGAAADEVTRTITVEGGTGGDTGEPEPTPTPTNGGGPVAVGGNGPIATGGGGGVPPTLALTTPIATTTPSEVATTTPAVCEEYLLEYIKLGADNNPDEVKKLEAFLNTFEGFNLPVDGIYDQADFDAVSAFQERYADDVLAPWGYDASTGYVYYTTRKKVNEIYCERAFPLTDEQSAEVVAFRAFLESLKAVGAAQEDIESAAEGQVGIDTSASTTNPGLALGGDDVTAGTELEGDSETQTETGLTAQFARAFDALAERISSRAIGAGLIILGILLAAVMFYNRRGKTPNTTKKA